MNSYRRGLRNGVLVDLKILILKKVNLVHISSVGQTWSNLVKLGQTCLNLYYLVRVITSPLGIRARIGMICRGCELEISGILLKVDLKVMDMSEFDVILGMDWLTVYRVVIDCERRRVTAYTQDGTRVVFPGDNHDILPQTVY